IAPRLFSMSEMEVRKMRSQAAVDLFGERILLFSRTQTGFDVANRDVAIKRSQRSSKGRCRIPLHKDQRGALPPQDRVQPRHARGRDIGKILARLHHSQIVVWSQAENS